ncbi:MAG: aspartyl protease family protein [Fulvivirga sp.]
MNNLGVIFFLVLTLPRAIAGQKIINDTGEIPFEMVKNTIVIEVNIQGEQRKFVVDTGGVLIVSQELQNTYNFEIINKTRVSDINKKEIAFKTVLVPDITIGNWKFDNSKALVEYLPDTYPNNCYGTDGIIGRDFFKDVLMQFDFKRKVMRLTKNPGVLVLDPSQRTRMDLSDRGLPEIELFIDGKKQRIEFDSGSGDLFSYKTKTAKKLKSKTKDNKLKFEGIFSFGVSSKEPSSSERYMIKVKELEIAGTKIVDFYSNLSKPSAPRIGAGILYYGVVTLDYQNNWFYLDPYETEPDKTFESFGFDIAKINDVYVIKWVLLGSAADSAGLKFGHKILKINGEDVAQITDGCSGYLNGYGFNRQGKVVVDYVTATGQIRSTKLMKEEY